MSQDGLQVRSQDIGRNLEFVRTLPIRHITYTVGTKLFPLKVLFVGFNTVKSHHKKFQVSEIPYRPVLAIFREGTVKKHPVYIQTLTEVVKK